MLKLLVGAASLAIIAFVGFYFYQVYRSDQSAAAASDAAARRAAYEACYTFPAALALASGRPARDEQQIARLNELLWECIALGAVQQADLVTISTTSLRLPDGYTHLSDPAQCNGALDERLATASTIDLVRRGALELQIRDCVIDGYLDPATVKGKAGDSLNAFLGLAGLAVVR